MEEEPLQASYREAYISLLADLSETEKANHLFTLAQVLQHQDLFLALEVLELACSYEPRKEFLILAESCLIKLGFEKRAEMLTQARENLPYLKSRTADEVAEEDGTQILNSSVDEITLDLGFSSEDDKTRILQVPSEKKR